MERNDVVIMARVAMLVVAMLCIAYIFFGCGGDGGDNMDDRLDEAGAVAAAADRPDCTQNIVASDESQVDANFNCGDGNRIGSDGQTGDNSTDRHDDSHDSTN